MECYVRLFRVYDSLTPYHGSWVLYRNVRTGAEIQVEEGEKETFFVNNNFIITWEEYQRRLEHETFGIETDKAEKYGFIGRNYNTILKFYDSSIEKIFPKVKLLSEDDKGYFVLRFLEILKLIHDHNQLDVFYNYENEGYFYKRRASYETIAALYEYYREVGLRLLISQYYKKEELAPVAKQKVNELIYHLFANHEGVFRTCDNLLDVEEFETSLSDEEFQLLSGKKFIPWQIRIPSPYDYEALLNGIVKLSYIGTSPTECAVINQGELNSYLRQNLQANLPYFYGDMLKAMSKDFPTLETFIYQQEKQDSTISLASNNKVYTIRHKIF